jgi:sulfate adenylyltransferase subunit 1 (EFTu-like GTPase family)
LSNLENVSLDDALGAALFRFPVQWVNRPFHDFRGYSGFVSGGAMQPGDAARILPQERDATIVRNVTADGDLEEAVVGQSVTLTLEE